MPELRNACIIPPPLSLPETITYVNLRVDPQAYPALVTELSQYLALPSYLEKAVLKRQALWLAGRWCACQALQGAGCETLQIPGSGLRGEPLWPEGWIGSISHSDTHISAAVASKPDWGILGLDNQPLIPLTTAVCMRISVEAERQHVPAGMSEQLWYTLIFSAKESLFKALYPQGKRYFGFNAARLEKVTHNNLQLCLLQDLGAKWKASQRVTGCWNVQEGQVFTAVWSH